MGRRRSSGGRASRWRSRPRSARPAVRGRRSSSGCPGASFVEAGGARRERSCSRWRVALAERRGRRAQRRHRLARGSGADRAGAGPPRRLAPWARAVQGGGRGAGDRVEPDQHGRRSPRRCSRRATRTSCRWPGRSWPIRRSSRKSRSSGRARGQRVHRLQPGCIDRSIFDRRVSCVVNPRAGYELELGCPGGAGIARATVAVVGGGPAGMEAARALAAAGHAVTLFEAAERLGGQFRMACRIPGKEDFACDDRVLRARTGAAGRDGLARGARARRGAFAGFDAVVVATGVGPRPMTCRASSCRTSSATPSCCRRGRRRRRWWRARRDHRRRRHRRRRRAPVERLIRLAGHGVLCALRTDSRRGRPQRWPESRAPRKHPPRARLWRPPGRQRHPNGER